jgi:hypothetical protein
MDLPRFAAPDAQVARGTSQSINEAHQSEPRRRLHG